MSEPLVCAEHLKKYYESRRGLLARKTTLTRALDDVSFSIVRGRTVGLVGESGCGKSTAGKLLLNLIAPTEGKVTFDGTVLFDTEKGVSLSAKEMTALRCRMQLIFQDPSSCLNPRKNVEQIISAGIRKHTDCSRSELRERCADIMEKCGLDRRQMMRYPHEFSGGQRQRIGIARALALHPQFIVCDEPTAALDVSIQSQILNLMLDMKEQFSLTYLFISHNLGVVEHFCDEILIMYLGRIVERGSCEEVYRHPCHPYTKLLLDSVPAVHPDQVSDHVPGLCVSAAPCQEGCRFANRCPCAKPVCQSQVPELREVSPGHFAACHNIP